MSGSLVEERDSSDHSDVTDSDKAEMASSAPRSVSGMKPNAHIRRTGTIGPANIITSALLSFFFTTVMLPPLVAGLVHLEMPDFDSIPVSNPVSEPGYELAAVVLSPQVHAGSVLVLFTEPRGRSCNNTADAAVARSSLTGYVFRSCCTAFLSRGSSWFLAVMEASATVLGRSLVE